jgi:hypothetical protein
VFSSETLDGSLAAYRTGFEKIATVVGAAVEGEKDRTLRVSAGLRAGLELLAEDPTLAQLLLTEPLASASPLRVEHERSLARLAGALIPVVAPGSSRETSENLARLVAGGLVSYLSGRVVAGETADLGASHHLLLQYLLAGTDAVAPR